MQLQLSTSFTALEFAPFVNMGVKSSVVMCVNWSLCPGSFPSQSTHRWEEEYHQKPGKKHYLHSYYVYLSLTFHAFNACQCVPCPKFVFLCVLCLI